MSQNQTKWKPIINGKYMHSKLCHICEKKLVLGEQYIWYHGCGGYMNICYKCMIELGKMGEEVKEYNEELLALPKKERDVKAKMLIKMEPEEN